MHSSRFNKPGDYFKLEIAGFPFILIMGKDRTVNGFHNVCRHRAYPIVKKEFGSSTVLGNKPFFITLQSLRNSDSGAGCRYHGWSYDTSGNLIKAPGFENITNFDKSANGLFKVMTYTTRQGLIFVNFDARPDCTPFNDFYKGLEDELDEMKFSNFEYVESFELDGEFNWKTLSEYRRLTSGEILTFAVDGYHECYHCPTAHPSFSKAIKVPTYKVIEKHNYARHSAEVTEPEPIAEPEEKAETTQSSSWFGWGSSSSNPAQKKKVEAVQGDSPGLWLSLFPLTGMNCYSYAWYSMRIVPKSAGRTVLEYDIYGMKGEDPAKIQEFIKFLKEVELEVSFNIQVVLVYGRRSNLIQDFDLCTLTQKNLKVGVYGTGQLHPEKENGVLCKF